MPRLLQKFLFTGALVLAFVWPARAQVSLDYYLPAGTSYDSRVPSPQQFFGFQVGEWHLRHDQLAAYMRELARSSDRVTLVEYARTYEQRPLLLLTITSPKNHKNIDNIRARHLALTDPAAEEIEQFDGMPVVVWLGYSVHGNEPSGSNASSLVAYYLAAAQGEEVEAMLENAVILLDPSINPDGLGRFAQWANMHKSKRPVADPNIREHREDWPMGRTNHYWFDLNRDWLPLQHPESRGRIEQFQRWLPNVLTDHHEMGTNATYFFQPGVPQRKHPLIPENNVRLTGLISQFHAKALDEIGSLYYSEESFDDFYFGKGSTYPDVNGSIGILFEQASSRGHLQESVNGEVSFPFTIRNHVTTSFSTIEAALSLKQELLAHMRDFYRNSRKEAKKAPVKGYVFGDGGDPARAFHFIEMLRRHKIIVHKLARETSIDEFTFQPGTAWVVPADQKKFKLITALFERRTTFTDSLFYDISAWTMPFAFNLPFGEIRDKSRVKKIAGALVEKPVFPRGEVAGGKSSYAYVFEWKSYYTPRALNRIFDAGLRAKVAKKTFSALTSLGKKEFGYGTIMVPLQNQELNADEIFALMQRIAAEDAVVVYALKTGLSVSGADLGSPSFAALRQPRILLAAGSGTSAYDVGEVWHLLDQRYDVPASIVDFNRLAGVDLNRYNTIIMPSGSYSGLDSNQVNRLRQWARNGGTLIAMGRTTNWLNAHNVVDVQFVKKQKKDKKAGPERRPYVKASSDRGAQVIGGAIFAAHLDRSHPIGYGYDQDEIAVFRRGTLFMKPSKDPYSTPLQYTDAPLLSGYIPSQNLERLRNSASVVTRRLGRGAVVLIADNFNFRAFWYGTNKLFANSIFFGPVIYGNRRF